MSSNLCHFCQSIEWDRILSQVFNPETDKPEYREQVKCGEHGLAIIRSNQDTCELCELISDASRALKPWWPIAEFLDRPERITCAFFYGRNRLGPGGLDVSISQASVVLHRMFAQLNPKYDSSAGLVRQRRHNTLPGKSQATEGELRNNSLNRLLVLAGLKPVPSTAQTFMQLHPCQHPIPTIDDYVRRGNPSLVFPTGRIVQPEVNTRLLGKWYDICLKSHGSKCEKPAWFTPGAVWPRDLRLIDVKQRCIVDVPAACLYFTLSYVWGGEKDPFQTTLGNLATLKTPGALDSYSLPKTINDALWLTREMGVDYLWVDRLCVIQDSDADKAIQLPQMDLVYSGAALTIVAASGTSLDGLAGLNNTPRTITQRTAHVTENLSVMNVLRLDAAYQASAWRTRGWTFQEGLCSRRSIVITSDQVFWSCESAKYCETIAFEDFPTTVEPGDIIFRVLSGHPVFGEFGGANFSYDELGSMIAAYNKRHLSVQGDILNAFMGVLNRVSLGSGHEFYWGHSASCMFGLSLAWVNITWQQDGHLPPKIPSRRRETHTVLAPDGSSDDIPFPSWSWLGWGCVEGITRCIPRQVNIQPELNITKLDVYGKSAPINSSSIKLEDTRSIKMNGIDASTSAGWKECTAIPPHRIHSGLEFRDSGRLLFWTSHSQLVTRENKIYSSSDSSRQIGELLPFWQHQVAKPEGKLSFIVVERKIDDYRYNDVRAERRLYLLLVHWVNREENVAERVCTAEVDEAAWVDESREWILVTLA
ncbi:HET-domain-containing protein [Xylaria bambusicola]|uniref:HET-domain-containing protein n=1 Tax=Xylaria bambusicola TaxID=326684 RepID=UPI002007DE9E|nr:HET-domain-containing protein [Xylaria bambusicola]KAI0508340.1 HET-domain-containing protein [Xylaria bambusicola]